MKRSSREWDKVGILLDRQANLNQLRVGTIQVYLVVVAAVLALLGGTEAASQPNSFVMPLGICLVGVGLLVLMYDLRLRARAYAVAVEVARSVPDTNLGPAKMKPIRFDEDLLFSMVLMLINSTLVYIGLEQGLIVGNLNGAIAGGVAIIFLPPRSDFTAGTGPGLLRICRLGRMDLLCGLNRWATQRTGGKNGKNHRNRRCLSQVQG
jgi:hypothetical protein